MIGEHAVDLFFGPLAAAEKCYEGFLGGALVARGVQEFL
jgi:hypothetical protein